MTVKTITLPADLVERLEMLARIQGQPLDEVLRNLLDQHKPINNQWALNLAKAMEEADIEWTDEAESASEHAREKYYQHRFERWQRTQKDTDNDDK